MRNVVRYSLKEVDYPMNTQGLIKKVNAAMSCQCDKRGYAAPVDILMDIGALSRRDYEKWRHGQVDYLERVCTMNLSKLSSVLRQIRVYAEGAKLKPSYTCYKQWGRKKRNGQGKTPVRVLRFSKSGNVNVERAYATHYLNPYRMEQLKAEHAGGAENGPS